MQRKAFLQSGILTAASYFLSSSNITVYKKNRNAVFTVNGPIDASSMGFTLIHEHILVDFIGAEKVSPNRYESEKVISKALPFLKQAYANGCRTLVDCTPPFLGRDVSVLQKLSRLTGLHIVTCTGYYGAAKEKFVPLHAYNETAQQIAARWVSEFDKGIDGTSVKPGFIKTGVDKYPLSEMQQNLIEAAAITHLATGLTIGVHTGDGAAALLELDILYKAGVSPEAWIWIHAQNEHDRSIHVKVAKAGGWVSFDGLNDDSINYYISFLKDMKSENLLNHVLISHDAGWFNVGDADGGNYRGYHTVFSKLIPAMKSSGFNEKDIKLIFTDNPARVLTIQKRKL